MSEHLDHKTRKGHVAFVSAGPGDPELLTLKARKELDRADVVIYDRLVGKGILELARRAAIMIDVGKIGFGASTPQSDINALILEHAASRAYVVRLKKVATPRLWSFGRRNRRHRTHRGVLAYCARDHIGIRRLLLPWGNR